MKLSILLFTVIGAGLASANTAQAQEKLDCKNVIQDQVEKDSTKCDPSKGSCAPKKVQKNDADSQSTL